VAEFVAGFMNFKTSIAAMALIALPFSLPSASAAKAYDVVKYEGKGPGVRVAFDFGYGYPDASEIKITESTSGKTIKFLPADGDAQIGTGKMLFVPEPFFRKKGNEKTKEAKEVLLQMDAADGPPPTVKGTYTADGKTVQFTLTKIEED
jgi:hypothetical protein